MEEKEAINQAIRGVEAGYRWLFERYRGPLSRYLSRAFRLPGEASSDVLQDAFVDAFAHLDELKAAERFFAWLLTIARRRALLYLSKAHREEEVLDTFLRESAATAYQGARERDQLACVVQELIEQLPPGEVKATVAAYYLEGAGTVDDLARRFDTNRGTITARLKRFRDGVRPRLAERLLEIELGA